MKASKFDEVIGKTPTVYATFVINEVPAWAETYGVKKGTVVYYMENHDTIAFLKKNGTAFPINIGPSYLSFFKYMTVTELAQHKTDIA